MKYWSVWNKNNELIGWNEDWYVCNDFIKTYTRSNPSDLLFIKKVKKKQVISEEDKYLVISGGVYIPEGFTDVYEITTSDLYDVSLAKSAIIKLSGKVSLSKSDMKALKKAAKILEEIEIDSTEYVPSINDFKEMKNHYEEVFNKANYE